MSAKRRIIPVFVPHLGCPNNCVFCNQRRISGETEPATAETVLSAIKAAGVYESDCSDWELAFYGGSFTAIEKEQRTALLHAAAGFVNRGGVLRLSTRPDRIDDEILKELLAAGVKTIELGCQSMDEEVLLKSGRGHSAQDTVNAVDLIRKYDFNLILQMMTGLPGDTLEKSLNTARALADLKPDGVRIYPTVIIRDTPLYDMWLDDRYREHTVEEAAKWCSEILPVFIEAGIPVIRLGLNPTDDLTGGDAIGGAYHPAFGEIVYSKIFLEKAKALLADVRNAKGITLGVSRSCVSRMSGHKKSNTIALKREYGFEDVKILGLDGMKNDEVRLIYVEK